MEAWQSGEFMHICKQKNQRQELSLVEKACTSSYVGTLGRKITNWRIAWASEGETVDFLNTLWIHQESKSMSQLSLPVGLRGVWVIQIFYCPILVPWAYPGKKCGRVPYCRYLLQITAMEEIKHVLSLQGIALVKTNKMVPEPGPWFVGHREDMQP